MLHWQALRQCGPHKGAFLALDAQQIDHHFGFADLALAVAQCVFDRRFEKGHKTYGGRKPGGSKVQLDLKAAILGALEAVDGLAYLQAVAKSDPRTFCTLLGRVLLLSLQHGGGVQHTISLELQR